MHCMDCAAELRRYTQGTTEKTLSLRSAATSTPYYLAPTTVSQLSIGSVYYYCEIGDGAEKLKSVMYNSSKATLSP